MTALQITQLINRVALACERRAAALTNSEWATHSSPIAAGDIAYHLVANTCGGHATAEKFAVTVACNEEWCMIQFGALRTSPAVQSRLRAELVADLRRRFGL